MLKYQQINIGFETNDFFQCKDFGEVFFGFVFVYITAAPTEFA